MIFRMSTLESIYFCLVVSRILCSSCVQDELIENTDKKGPSAKDLKIMIFSMSCLESIHFCLVVSRILCSRCVQDELIENTDVKGPGAKDLKIMVFGMSTLESYSFLFSSLQDLLLKLCSR